MQLPATLNLSVAAAVHRQVQDALAATAAGAVFQVDASALEEFDTSALAVLLEARRVARAKGLGFALQAAPAKLQQLAALYGVDELLTA